MMYAMKYAIARLKEPSTWHSFGWSLGMIAWSGTLGEIVNAAVFITAGVCMLVGAFLKG